MASVDLTPQQRAVMTGKMRQLHISQERLSKWMQISQARLSEKLSGKARFAREEIAQIAGLLEIPDLMRLYPETMDEEQRQQRRLWLATQIFEESLAKLSHHDMQEVLFALALMLESKRPYGETPQTRLLRGLAKVQFDPSYSGPDYETPFVDLCDLSCAYDLVGV